MDWSLDQLLLLRKHYASSSDDLLAERFGRTVDEIRSMASLLALAKNKGAFVGIRKMPRWTVEEMDRLGSMYITHSNVEIALELGRSLKSITSKASQLHLLKTPQQLADMGSANRALRRISKQ